MRLYHREVFWDTMFDTEAKYLFNKKYSAHLWEHLKYSDSKHNINVIKLNQIIDELIAGNRDYYLYEVETTFYNGMVEVVKAVVRTSYNDTHDISIVFDANKVRTAWINHKNDTHKTLDINKYYYPHKRKVV